MNRPEMLIEILHDVQGRDGCIGDEAMRTIAEALNISRAEVYGVVSFYEDFTLEPRAPGTVKLCRAEACQAVGSDQLAAACNESGVPHETVYCLGNCALGPVAMVDGRLVGRVDVEKLKAATRGMGK